jgi:hypothetical protein
MRPIVLHEVRQFQVQERPAPASAWAHQQTGFGRLGAAHAYLGNQPEGPRRVKHPPLRFDKGMAVDQLA